MNQYRIPKARDSIHKQRTLSDSSKLEDEEEDLPRNCTPVEESSEIFDNEERLLEAEHKESKPLKKTNGFGWLIPSMVLIILLIGVFAAHYPRKSAKIIPECKFHDLLPEKYANKLKYGIGDVKQQMEDMAVFLFVHEGSHQARNMIQVIAERSAKCLGSKQVEIPPSAFTNQASMQDYGTTIERVKSELVNNRVMVVANLNEIPTQTALALHFICDPYTPIDKGVIIFLSAVVPKINGGVTNGARELLLETWQQMKAEKLDALLVRLTRQIIPLIEHEHK